MSQHDAGEAAVRRLGSPAARARNVDRFSIPLKALFALATAATVLVALWLFWVIAAVLPARDPGHVAMWRVVAFAYLAYGGLCLAYMVLGPRYALLRWGVLILSVSAVSLGAYAIVQVIRVANAGGHFEGYLVLMGLLLAGHGLTAILHTAVTAAVARRLRAL